MGRAEPIVVGSEHFGSRKELRERIRELVAKYVPSSFLDEADTAFVLYLFQHHPDYDRKVGVGINRVQVRLDMYGNKHFQIHRADGSDDDISWVECLKTKR